MCEKHGSRRMSGFPWEGEVEYRFCGLTEVGGVKSQKYQVGRMERVKEETAVIQGDTGGGIIVLLKLPIIYNGNPNEDPQ